MKNNGIKSEKIAIFGGSFDPPHYGHYDIVKNLEKNFDRVIVVPSYISPFKQGDVDAEKDAKTRLKLCKSFFGSQKTEVCSREINKRGVSYSVDTAQYFRRKFKDADIAWVIGSEEAEKLGLWHDFDRLKKLVRFLIVPRPGYVPDPDTLKSLKKCGAKLSIAKFVGLDVSSSQIEIDNAFGRSNRFMPEIAAALVRKKGLFNPYGKYVAALYKYNLSEKRIVHTYGVAIRGAELAKLYGYPVRDAIIACILHDIAKSIDPKDYAGKVDAEGFPPPTVHGPIGAYLAKREFSVSDEIEHAIYYHPTACENMSLLDEIVYLADKTEMGRNYNEVYYLRYLCSIDRDFAMYYALSRVIEYKNNEMSPCEHSNRALEVYTRRVSGREMPEKPPVTAPVVGPVVSTLPIVRSGAEVKPVAPNAKSVRAAADKSVAPSADKSVAGLRDFDKRPSLRRRGDVMAVKGASDEKTAHTVSVDGRRDDSAKNIAFTVAEELSLHKARDIDIVDLSGKTIIADYFVIASASSSTAVKALCDYAEDKLTKEFGLDPLKRDVDREWAALDYGGVIIHIFTDKMREFYNIERLWSDGHNIERFGD